MQSVELKVNVAEKASRVELLVRLVYWIPLVIVGFVLGVLAGISWVITLVTVLVLGKRYASLTNLMKMDLVYKTNMSAYYMLLTDERPPIMPQGL